MTSRVVARGEFQALFDQFDHSAWRLEIQGHYDEPDEGELLARFVAGEQGATEAALTWFADWPAWITEQRAAGKHVDRVRVLTDPLTDYLRWQLGIITAPAVEAGEDIRVLPADVATGLPLGSQDFWMFDDHLVAVLEFDQGQVTHARLLDDPTHVEPFHAIRAAAWDHALRFTEYQQTRP